MHPEAERFHLAGLFVIYRGAQMREDSWIKDYVEEDIEHFTHHDVNLSGFSSCTQNLKVALEFCFKESEFNYNKIPVLFVISCQNYESITGFRLNNSAYATYPYEEEILLMEGSRVVILGIVPDCVITNSHD